MATSELPKVGDKVRIKRGICGEGYRFVVKELGTCGLGKPIVYGRNNFGPRWTSDVEVIEPADRCRAVVGDQRMGTEGACDAPLPCAEHDRADCPEVSP